FDAYFGFTGATGGLNNNHWVDDLAINMGADAGPDQVVESGDEVTLDGSKSVNAIGFLWDQVGGEPLVEITNENEAVASFVAPSGVCV
ncbi:hypothetical protein HQ563_16090, partial [bacterium]|nr:hypothetical protein [bacterium]